VTRFDQLVFHFIRTNELGDYNAENFSITLYGILNDEKHIERIRSEIEVITKHFKMIVLNPGEKCTNIKILDIDL